MYHALFQNGILPYSLGHTHCRQIEIDSKFLELQQIMDYSLLLGVHYRAPQQLRPYNQSRTVDGLAILAEEGECLIQSEKQMVFLFSFVWLIFILGWYF